MESGRDNESLVQATLKSLPGSPRRGAWWLSLAALILVGTVVSWQWQQRREAPLAPDSEPIRPVALSPRPRISRISPRLTESSSEVMATSLPDRSAPPFAPASAIELVILPRRESVQLTIYHAADLTLVRERRHCTLQKGWNWLQFMWANTRIDPTSLELIPLEQTDQIALEQLSFPPRLGQLGRWLFWSDVEGQVPFEMSYLTSGLGWNAFYTGTLASTQDRMDLKGYVRVTNQSGEDYEAAQVRLVVGEVQLLEEIASLAERLAPYGSPAPLTREWAMQAGRLSGEGMMGGMGEGFRGQGKQVEELSAAPKAIIKKKLSEYQLYTIEGTETIPHGWSKRLESMAVADVNVSYLFKVDPERHGDTVRRFLNFHNDKAHHLGDQPLPAGRVALYRHLNPEGHLAYEGNAEVPYVPVGQEVDLSLGPARLVTVTPRLMDFKQEGFRFAAPDGDLSGWDEIRVLQVELTNGRERPVAIEMTFPTGTPAWTIEVNQAIWQYEKLSSERIRFTVDLPEQTRRTLPYTLRTYHGDRAEQNPSVP